MLHIAVPWARDAGLDELYAVYPPTSRNKPCADVLRRSGLQARPEHVFAWLRQQDSRVCPDIRLIYRTGGIDAPPAEGARGPGPGQMSESLFRGLQSRILQDLARARRSHPAGVASSVAGRQARTEYVDRLRMHSGDVAPASDHHRRRRNS